MSRLILFHGNNVYHNIVIFAINKVFDIKIFDAIEISEFFSPVSISQKN